MRASPLLLLLFLVSTALSADETVLQRYLATYPFSSALNQTMGMATTEKRVTVPELRKLMFAKKWDRAELRESSSRWVEALRHELVLLINGIEKDEKLKADGATLRELRTKLAIVRAEVERRVVFVLPEPAAAAAAPASAESELYPLPTKD